MRWVVLVMVLLCMKIGYAQDIINTHNDPIETIQGSRIKFFIDSLRNQVLSDTIRFNRANLVHTLSGTRNSKSYSKLFIVNAKYYYKLDIIENTEVVDFANAILVPEIIDSIHVIPATFCNFMFGRNGINGAYVIYSHIQSTSCFKVSGLTRRKKEYNNFYQRRAGELLVHE
ncbi:MAG: hypothetical protein NTW29_02060 [Bacteroidetes bacterium]|nr:hypothetical protein [Bacteroidota bacterium]